MSDFVSKCYQYWRLVFKLVSRYIRQVAWPFQFNPYYTKLYITKPQLTGCVLRLTSSVPFFDLFLFSPLAWYQATVSIKLKLNQPQQRQSHDKVSWDTLNLYQLNSKSYVDVLLSNFWMHWNPVFRNQINNFISIWGIIHQLQWEPAYKKLTYKNLQPDFFLKRYPDIRNFSAWNLPCFL